MRYYYLAMLKMRLATLVHRSAQTSQFSLVVAYSEEGCNILKRLISVEAEVKQSPPHTRGNKISGVKTVAVARGTAAGRLRAKVAKTSTAAVHRAQAGPST